MFVESGGGSGAPEELTQTPELSRQEGDKSPEFSEDAQVAVDAFKNAIAEFCKKGDFKFKQIHGFDEEENSKTQKAFDSLDKIPYDQVLVQPTRMSDLYKEDGIPFKEDDDFERGKYVDIKCYEEQGEASTRANICFSPRGSVSEIILISTEAKGVDVNLYKQKIQRSRHSDFKSWDIAGDGEETRIPSSQLEALGFKKE